ncbi:MAG: hypothetical protein ABR598_06765 [Candidatus Dormibacteria bacterium]
MKQPPTQFAEAPEGRIAYQVLGDGPIDLMPLPTWGWNIDLIWESPLLDRYLRQLAAFSRLIIFNPRGSGPSDRFATGMPTIEDWSADCRWVLDAAGSKTAALLAMGDTGVPTLLHAAAHPERTRALVLLDCYAYLLRDEDYPAGMPPRTLERANDVAAALWGTGEVARLTPGGAGNDGFCEWLGRVERNTMTSGFFREMRGTLTAFDARSLLASVRAPTLVISHAESSYIRPAHSRYLADHIAGARLVERPGRWDLYWRDDVEAVLDEVSTFLTGTRGTTSVDDRVLATVLFTDIVGSTAHAARLGDDGWTDLLHQHDLVTGREVERFRGHFVKSTGDGLLATFDGPARAIRCARAIVDAVRALGLEVRTGLHTGEVEFRDGDVHGIAVHIGERVMGHAGPGEVVVSGAMPPLLAGSGIVFSDRGLHSLKGVPGEWRILAVDQPPT